MESNPRDNDPLHAPINARLAEIVAASTSPPSWYIDWIRLGPESSEEDRLAVYQAVRGAFRGHGVFHQVLAYAPEDEQPGMKLDTLRRSP